MKISLFYVIKRIIKHYIYECESEINLVSSRNYNIIFKQTNRDKNEKNQYQLQQLIKICSKLLC